MSALTPELETLGDDLTQALRRFRDRRRRRRRLVRVAASVLAAFGASAAVATASGIGDDLELDPTKWSIFERGSVAGGQAEYVKAHATDGSGDSTFIVEHDAGMDRYEAFVLHERVVDAAGGTAEAAAVCTPAELTRAERVALAALRAAFPAGAGVNEGRAVVDAALETEFSGQRCRGIEYGGERARFVYAGIEPPTMLMPGVR